MVKLYDRGRGGKNRCRMCVNLHTDTPSKGEGRGGVFALDFAKIWRFVNIMYIMRICICSKINDLADL